MAATFASLYIGNDVREGRFRIGILRSPVRRLRLSNMTPNHDPGSDDLLARADGNAAAGGMNFQAKVEALFACQMLAERQLEERLTGDRIRSLRFETEAPLDEILVEIETNWIFVQAKNQPQISASGPDNQP